ncbi:MAG: ATP-binding protein [Candidatus Omnitrophota bacterium]
MNEIANYMTKNIVSVDCGDSIVAALNLMKKSNIGSVLVSRNGKISGIFTERDLLQKIDFSRSRNLGFVKVEEAMTSNLKTAKHTTLYTDVIKIMEKNHIRHMPITKNGKVVGVVSLRDLLIYYEEDLKGMLAKREKEIYRNIERVKKSEKKFRAIFQDSPLPITLVDKKQLIIAWNPSFEQLLGLRKAELLNMPIKKLYPPLEWKRIHDLKIDKPGDKKHIETQVINKEGGLINVDVSINLLRDARGEELGSIGIMRDITEHKKLGELREQFVAVSHELRTPLIPIREGIGQVLEGLHGETTKKQRKYLSVALQEVNRLKRIIDDLLDVFKIESGEIVMRKSVIDMVQLVEMVVLNFSPETKKHGLKIRTRSSQKTIYAYTDKDKVVQILSNLISNAVKFTKKGSIEVRLEVKGKMIVCSVSDTGIGIKSKDMGDLFKKFKQVGRFAGSQDGGTGLGLAICKDLVKLVNGKIYLERRYGKGSTFKFTLPLYIQKVA